MPTPTKPACSGSWPEPPPESSATLPDLGKRRRTNLRSGPSATMSACAAAKPSRLSARTVSAAFISFFMTDPPCVFAASLAVTRCRRRISAAGGRSRRSSRRAARLRLASAEIRQPRARRCAFARTAWTSGKAPRMGAPVGREEIAPVLRREMADLEDRLEMLRRDRHGIGWIGDLRDEAAVLAERPGQTLARSGRPIVQHPLEDAPCIRPPDLAGDRGRSFAHRPFRPHCRRGQDRSG